jgi:hypothetical protein
MFNLFKRKKVVKEEIIKEAVPEKVKQTTSEEDSFLDVNFTNKMIPDKYKDRHMFVQNWWSKSGDIVEKGTVLGLLAFHSDGLLIVLDSPEIEIIANVDGVLETHVPCHGLYGRGKPQLLSEGEKIFTIHTKDIENKKVGLLHQRFESIPIVTTDPFSRNTEITWENVAGRNAQSGFNNFLMWTKEVGTYKHIRLYFTLNYLDNKDFIVFRFYKKEYDLTIGSKISFLFSNKEVVVFDVSSKPYQHSADKEDGKVFEVKMPITINELESFKTLEPTNWRIEFAKTKHSIVGSVANPQLGFIFNKFASDYHSLVQKEVVDYQPLIVSEKSNEPLEKNNEICYLYLMKDTSNDMHKIGISNKPEYREKTLQSEKPTIEMVCNKSYPNRKIAMAFEQALHGAYADKRVRGEWFNLSSQEVIDVMTVLTS